MTTFYTVVLVMVVLSFIGIVFTKTMKIANWVFKGLIIACFVALIVADSGIF